MRQCASASARGTAAPAAGRLVVCEHGDRRVSRIDLSTMKREVLADHINGKRFNSPNDLCFSKKGDIYFTDPPYGLVKNWDDPARELDYCGVYRLTPDG